MTEIPVSKREAITSLFDAARVNGVAYLLAIIALGSATIPELVDIIGDERHTIGRYLNRLESRQFLIRVQDGRVERWFPTPKAFGLLNSEPMKEVFLPPSSSSSSDPGSDQSDQIRSGLVPEEEEESRQEKYHLARQYNLTGRMAQSIIEDAWITPLRLVAWMVKVHSMARDGFGFRKSPEAYAIMCLLKHHEPPNDALHQAPALLDVYLRTMPGNHEEDEEDEE